MCYSHILFDYECLPDNAGLLLQQLKQQNCRVDILCSEHTQFDRSLSQYADVIRFDFQSGDLSQTAQDKSGTLWIGASGESARLASEAGIDFALALWGCHSVRHIYATHYLNLPNDIFLILKQKPTESDEMRWLKWAIELQFIGQTGCHYSQDVYDRERFERIRELSAEIVSQYSGLPMAHVTDVFCNETGFQTPKLDCRAAIFEQGKILLVKENSGYWSLPGGWVDVNQSIRANTVKEVKEEAGLDVIATRLIALQDRNLHNTPVYAYGICKVFVQCEVIGGHFVANSETLESGWFGLEQLPELSEDKTTVQQIALCFEACRTENWQPVFD
ncbi:NUDIX hydrolase [Budviciaceae bacterium CWB-B4]|uniref:NUDIX hydrolase n=1 Tax=Limnobaculum xujianqingii TaxID=2738837 RepID=A0A9D7AHQ5_9GAMM|nr:NUDIX hydrolase [Limnobaculum xujianqingii]MBK5073030.1 NUDIX hydrolase [Limnobaculum xujianqingii]MBK5176339.1 NUDIX hydrolase [Limnobaculum xujianqingii]